LHDNHSRFVPASHFASEFDLPDETAGRPWPGMDVWPAREDAYLFIWDVCDQGGAHDAGLHRGDIILAIDGEEVIREEEGYSRELLRKLYADQPTLKLTVWQGPDTEPQTVTIQNQDASGCDGWYYTTLSESPHIGYIRVPEYSGNAEANILDMLHKLEEEGPLDGLIYDQRHNPGGNADAAIAIFTTGIFGEQGKLRENATRTIWRIRGPIKWNETTPMVVLSDGASHSAAEYFATAMKQSGRATLVGMPTAGNTEGITGFSLPDGSLIRLAIETLILPNGETMEGTGVLPDVEVPLGQWGLRQEPDSQLQRALMLLASAP
jgi:carboxyl-terminal processing protease